MLSLGFYERERKAEQSLTVAVRLADRGGKHSPVFFVAPLSYRKLTVSFAILREVRKEEQM